MKRKLLMLTMAIALMLPTRVKADEIKVHHAWATAYCLNGITAAGTKPFEGRTVAGKKEWMGCTMILWLDDGDGVIKPSNYLGSYVVEDRGGQTIEAGTVIDLYIKDYQRAREFGSKRVVFQIIPAEG